MLKYRCQLCGRIHWSRIGLKAGYCTTCGPRGLLIMDINWNNFNRVMVKAANEATEGIRNLGVAMGNINIEGVAKAVLDSTGRTVSRGTVE